MNCSIFQKIALVTFVWLSIFAIRVDSNLASSNPNIDIYAQLPRTQSVRVSPDGKYIAMLAPFRGSKAVFVYNLEDSNAKTTIIPTPDKSIVKAVDWASDKHIVMLARIRRKGSGSMRHYSTLYSRWIATNVETENQVILMKDKITEQNYRLAYGGGVVHDLPNDPDNILMSFSEFAGKPLQRHYRVNLETGDEKFVRSLNWDTGNVVLSLDGENILAREEYNDGTGNYKVFVGDGEKEQDIYTNKFDTSKNRTDYLVTVYEGKALMQETEKAGLTLFTIDPATKERSVFNFGADIDIPAGYDYGPIFDPMTGSLLGLGYTDDLYREVYTAEPYKTWHKQAKNALKGMEVNIASRTRDNSLITLYAQSPTNAGEFYLFEPGKGEISSLGGAYPELKAQQVAKTVRSDFKARDGLEIPAYLTFPPGKSKIDGPLPLIVMPHGGPVARDTADFDFWAQYLATQGYLVFKPQFRGSEGFGYYHEQKGYGEFGDGMLTDTIDGVKYLIDNSIADATKICVTGASYGGYQALALPMIEPDMFKCAISVNGVSHIPDILKYEVARTGANSGTLKFWEKIIGNRFDDKAVMLDQSPAENVEKIRAEILLVHGTDDMTVPLKQSKTMAKALKKAGRSDDIVLLPNDDHNLSLPESRKKLLEVSEALFEKHLK